MIKYSPKEKLDSKIEILDLLPEVEEAWTLINGPFREGNGGYKARSALSGHASAATTPTVLISKLKAGMIDKNNLDEKTKEDIEKILRLFGGKEKAKSAWCISAGQDASVWPTSWCVWALSELGYENEKETKDGVKYLLTMQKNGGWPLSDFEDKRRVLFTYYASTALISYAEATDSKELVKEVLKNALNYFKNTLKAEKEDSTEKELSPTDYALALQGLYDISSFLGLNDEICEEFRNPVIKKLNESVETGRCFKLIINVDIIQEKAEHTSQWDYQHFNLGILSILAIHSQELSTFINMCTILENIKKGVVRDKFGMGWGDVEGEKEAKSYATALMLYTLYDFVRQGDFSKMIESFLYEIGSKTKYSGEGESSIEGTRQITAAELFDEIKLHPIIVKASCALFKDSHYPQAILEAYKAVNNYVKEKSGKTELDGGSLMLTVFSKNNPIIKLNHLKDRTDKDEQEGFMHIFKGVMLGIRNPKAHDNIEQKDPYKTLEYLSMASLLLKRVDDAIKDDY